MQTISHDVSTLAARDAIRAANPGYSVSEADLRRVIRQGRVPRPPQLGRCLAWSSASIAAAAKALGLKPPQEVA